MLGEQGQARETAGELVVAMSCLCSFDHQAIVQNLLKWGMERAPLKLVKKLPSQT